ncbi:uncharacterized protein K489DRAFT_352527 [Dissoconium aciculare CBS 342.82]|uniref:Multiple RNA-binding domain-containing protein 1 n=1 Tax=Dissoconium aciculare CBS 342.82 TaxID=1314786 RepID=A0A6J3MBI1_9PEZI|nr:uncharacterized protein K489DRAFT_352527 [Dissoconium aciculare CBS 342.82]KAF1825228.1 hypothetical protein K489DRAFT_352527 [Dissoconium aciculare CBS 342.82]
MASSRIFVKALPPSFTEDEFRKHFSQNGKRDVTDAKLFPRRRIGYVGFRTPEDAQKAVKYFNKTFIRMSRIGVEIATPIDETNVYKGRVGAPTGRRDAAQPTSLAQPDNSMKRKREIPTQEEQDPKMKEFLDVMRPKTKTKVWSNGDAVENPTEQHTAEAVSVPAVLAEEASDDEYETVPKKIKEEQQTMAAANTTAAEPESRNEMLQNDASTDREQRVGAQEPGDAGASIPTPDSQNDPEPSQLVNTEIETARTTMRLFVRNLPYDVTTEALEAEFSPYGNLEEVHVSVDPKTGSAKGFAFIQYSDPDSAEQAFVERDGQIFQGRLLHILPSKEPRSSKLDDFELSKLPLKKQQLIKKKRDSESKSFNWNSLFMNADAVVANVADRLGLSKSEVLDPTSSDAAVRQAHAETHVIQETKAYFRSQGVDLDSFKKRQRGDTAILIKNIPYDLGKDELKRLCEENGDVTRFAIPPSGAVAIVEYKNAAQCKNAWSALSYRRVKNTVLMLEKAPADVFAGKVTSQTVDASVNSEQGGVEKVSATDLKGADQTVPDTVGTATLFVRNLNFTTTSALLTDTFKSFEGFMSARVKTKTDPKKPGQILSMGFGFLEFQSASQAQVALKVMDGHLLEGHKLQIRASHRGTDAAEERRKTDAQKKAAAQSTKVIIKNLPFEVTKKDIRALFGAYGQLRSVRVPQKLDRSTRGFAFADFMNAKEAQNAMESLRDTHLLGRRLVLDFAAEEPQDAEAEIEKLQQKVGAQVNKLALQKLTSGGRKKFTTQNDEDIA